MKRLALLLFVLLMGLARAQSNNPAAVVGSISGPVRTLTLPAGGGKLSAATPGKLKTLQQLNAGVFVQLAQGGSVTLAYTSDGHLERLTGPCVVRVGADGSHLLKGARSALKVEKSQLGAALRPTNPARLKVGSGTTLSVTSQEGMPTFSFNTNQAGPYLVTVFQGGNSLWSSETASTSVLYDGPVLSLDTPYVWQIQAGSTVLGAMRFEVPSHGATQSLGQAQAEVQAAPDDAARQALWAAAQDQRGNLPQAVNAAQAALKSQPQDAALMNRLSGMLQEMGQEAEAQRFEGQARMYEDVEGPSVDPNGDLIFGDYINDLPGIYAP